MERNSQNRDGIKFPGEICLIASDQDLAEVDFSRIETFGFDTETKSAFKKGADFKTALLQLYSSSLQIRSLI